MVQGREFAFVSLLWRAAVEQIYREDGGGGAVVLLSVTGEG